MPTGKDGERTTSLGILPRKREFPGARWGLSSSPGAFRIWASTAVAKQDAPLPPESVEYYQVHEQLERMLARAAIDAADRQIHRDRADSYRRLIMGARRKADG